VPLTDAVIVAVPALLDLNVAEYVPFELSVTDETVPKLLDIATLAPPEVKLFEDESFNCTVIVEELELLATTDVVEAATVDLLATFTVSISG
jgi:hypothetical protein